MGALDILETISPINAVKGTMAELSNIFGGEAEPPPEYPEIPPAAPRQAAPQPGPQEMFEPELVARPPGQIQEGTLSLLTQGLMLDDQPSFEAGLTKVVEQNMKQLGMGGYPQAPDISGITEGEEHLRGAADTSSKMAEDLTVMYDELKPMVQDLQYNNYKKAEEEAFETWRGAEFEMTHGLPREEFDRLNDIIAFAAQAPDEPTTQKQAREARQELAKAQAAVDEPNPMRLWENLGGFQQFLFILMNAVGSAGAAISGGPTPLDVAMNLMDKDYQAQKERYSRLRGKADSARSAYGLAAKRTENELERAAYAKNLMLSVTEMRLKEAGLHQQADQLAQTRTKLMHDWTVGRAVYKQQNAIAGLNAALTLRNQRLVASARQAQAAPQAPFGMAYLPSAPRLSDQKVADLQKASKAYNEMQRAVGELIQLRQDASLMEQAKISLGVADEAGVIRAKFAEIVDNIRDFYNWGARFEQTEAEQLVRGYLGSEDPTDIDIWGSILAGLNEFQGAMAKRWTEGLHKGFGLVLTGEGASPAQGYNYMTGEFEGGQGGQTARQPDESGKWSRYRE